MDWRKKPRTRPTEAARNIQALMALLPPGGKRDRLVAKELEKDAELARKREQRRELREEKRAKWEALRWRDQQDRKQGSGGSGNEED